MYALYPNRLVNYIRVGVIMVEGYREYTMQDGGTGSKLVLVLLVVVVLQLD